MCESDLSIKQEQLVSVKTHFVVRQMMRRIGFELLPALLLFRDLVLLSASQDIELGVFLLYLLLRISLNLRTER